MGSLLLVKEILGHKTENEAGDDKRRAKDLAESSGSFDVVVHIPCCSYEDFEIECIDETGITSRCRPCEELSECNLCMREVVNKSKVSISFDIMVNQA